jgi:phosphoglycerate dehydrogenase-like enzyme
MTRVAILDDYQHVALSMADWKSLPADTEVVVFEDHLADLGALAERLAGFDVVMAMRERTPFPRALLERLPRLRMLITAGMRNASIDVAAATERGVVVCGTAGLPYPTAELTWGLILALFRRIPAEDRATREGRWQTSLGLGLNGKTLSVLGLGSLGSRVAKVGLALEMTVLA